MAIDPKTLGQVALGVGALGTAFTGAVSSNASSKKAFKYQSRLQQQAAALNYDYSLKYLQNQYNAQRSGLESAGYNPMLAVQNGTGGANSSFTSAGQATAPDYTAGISTGLANAQSFQRLRNETEQAEAISHNQRAEAINKLEENPFIAPKRKAEIGNIEADTNLKSATIENLKERLELDRMLGFMGIDTTRRGQDLVYNAATEANEINRNNNNIRNILLGIGGLAVPGFGALKGAKSLYGAYKTSNYFKKYKKFKDTASYYKDFSTRFH